MTERPESRTGRASRTAGSARPRAVTTDDLAGTVFDGRYRLDRLVANAAKASLWTGTDLVLARQVAVRVVGGYRDRTRFLEAALRAGRLANPAIAAILDAARDPVTGAAYVVRDWVDGRSLEELLADGPAQPPRATTLALRCAEAMTVAHAGDVVHGRLHLRNVFVTDAGRVIITDPEVGAALDDPTGGPRDPRQDVVAIGRLLHAALTGTWPGEEPAGAYGLPAAPRAEGRAVGPRQLRAGVPRDLDAIVTRTLDSRHRAALIPIATAAELVAALKTLPAEPLGIGVTTDDGVDIPTRRTLPHWVRRVIPIAVLGLIAGAGWLLGLGLGTVPHQPGSVLPSVGPEASAKSGPALAQFVVKDYDPPPGDGREGTASVPLSHDGDPSTAWETDTYQGSPQFGGLKKGVGLLVDLGVPTAVKRVDLVVPIGGGSLEIRVADTVGATADAFSVVATSNTASNTTLSLVPSDLGTKHRFWLVWLTSLPQVSGGYRGGIAEMAFRT